MPFEVALLEKDCSAGDSPASPSLLSLTFEVEPLEKDCSAGDSHSLLSLTFEVALLEKDCSAGDSHSLLSLFEIRMCAYYLGLNASVDAGRARLLPSLFQTIIQTNFDLSDLSV